MAIPIIMPKVGQSVETCILAEWHVKKGDEVKNGDLLFSFETDKATIDEYAKADGVILELFYKVGDEVPVLVNIGAIGQPGESVDEYRNVVQNIKADNLSGDQALEQEKFVEDKAQDNLKKYNNIDEIKISPRAKKYAETNRIIYDSIEGSGPGGRIIMKDVEKASPGLTYAAYEHAKASGSVDLPVGSGIGNRITLHDLENQNSDIEEYIIHKISNIRKRISDAMFKSLQNSAQLTHHISVDVKSIQSIRTQLKAKSDAGAGITINDMVCFAIINSLKQHPEINGHFNGTETKEYKSVHLGIAVDTPKGLLVPAIKNADKMSLEQLSDAIKKRAEECRSGRISPDLLSSEAATFTVSNLGVYGIEMFTPVLNIPQIGIIGVNTIIQRPADIGGGIIGIVPFIGISLTYDHRAIDGAPASRFLQTVKKEIETFSL